MGCLAETQIETPVDIWAQRKLVARALPWLKWRRHGIGALQAYVFEGTERELRVHIWSRALMLPGIEDSGNAHNHRFTLRSTILHGALRHTEWQLGAGSGYSLYDFVHARLHTDETRAEMHQLDPFECSVEKVGISLHEGTRYTFNRGAYHSSEPLTPLVVTLVEKLDQHEERARVIAPSHIPPVPAFSGEELDERVVGELVCQAELCLRAG